MYSKVDKTIIQIATELRKPEDNKAEKATE